MTTSVAYILVAALFQTGWLMATKALRKDRLKKAFQKSSSASERWKGLWPPLGYLGAGIGNIVFLTLSMETLPASVAYAMWTGVVMLFAAGADRIFYNRRFSVQQYVYLSMVLLGAAGLNYLSREGISENKGEKQSHEQLPKNQIENGWLGSF